MKTKRLLSVLMIIVMMITLLPNVNMKAAAADTHSDHCVCGKTHSAIGTHATEENPTWVAINSADDFVKNKASGYYYLTADIELSAKWDFTSSRNIVLCLNGHDITYTGSSKVPFISGSTVLDFTLTDCSDEPGAISGFSTTYGGAINAKKSFTMYNGNITGNTATQGGGVYVDQSATFYMYGGKITGNTASTLGGGVFVKGAMEVAGAPVVAGNNNSNTATTYPSSMYKHTKNIYSSSDPVVIGNGGLTAGAQLDITPKFPVSSTEKPAAITVIATGCTSDPTDYITYTSGFDYTTQYDASAREFQLVYNVEKLTVTFDMQGHGTQVEAQSVETGTYATEPSPAPTADGYIFGGWYTTPECGYWDDFIFDFFKITENKTLFAKWTPAAPEIDSSEDYTSEYNNSEHTLEVTVTKVSGLTYSYQWYKDGKAAENKIDGATASTYTVENVSDSGVYYCMVTVSDNASSNTAWSDGINVSVTKASVAAPTSANTVNETVYGKADGKITGVDASMEYKKDGDTYYTAVTGTEITDLEAGTYFVRYKETDNYLASSDFQIAIAIGKTDSISVIYKDVTPSDAEGIKTYEIVLAANGESEINELASADLAFAFTKTPVPNGAMSFTVAPMKDFTLSRYENEERYMFNYNGVTAFEGTASEITVGTVTIEGYGDFVIATANVDSNIVNATTLDNNIVDSYTAEGATDNDDTTGSLITTATASGTIHVPVRKLIVNIDFPNAVANNNAAYQDMTVTVSGADLEENLVIKLGEEGSITPMSTYVSKVSEDKNVTVIYDNNTYNIVITDLLSLNNTYTITVEGAGYRTARYTVTMNCEKSKTLNFWNNVMDNKINVEENNASSANKVTFLAGDIVKDGTINIYDLAAVVSYFGEIDLSKDNKSEYAKYDLNRDTMIDSKDVAYVLVSWNN